MIMLIVIDIILGTVGTLGVSLAWDVGIDDDGQAISGIAGLLSIILAFMLLFYMIDNPVNNNIPDEYCSICYEINDELTNKEVGQIINLTYTRYTDEEIVTLLNPYLSEQTVKNYANRLSEARE